MNEGFQFTNQEKLRWGIQLLKHVTNEVFNSRHGWQTSRFVRKISYISL